MNPHSCRSSALMAMVAVLTLACGSKSGMRGGLGTGGAVGATQTIGSGGGGGNPGTGGSMGTSGIPGTGGVGSGGRAGAGGGMGSGGSTGTGGGTSVDVQDAGRDAPPAVDAAVDLPVQTCGDAAACGSGQACVLSGGGPAPRCLPQADGGGCSSGLVPVASCGSYGVPDYQPGCTDPSPVPQCVGLADGCSDPCSCVCPFSGAGCYKGPGYTICSYP